MLSNLIFNLHYLITRNFSLQFMARTQLSLRLSFWSQTILSTTAIRKCIFNSRRRLFAGLRKGFYFLRRHTHGSITASISLVADQQRAILIEQESSFIHPFVRPLSAFRLFAAFQRGCDIRSDRFRKRCSSEKKIGRSARLELPIVGMRRTRIGRKREARSSFVAARRGALLHRRTLHFARLKVRPGAAFLAFYRSRKDRRGEPRLFAYYGRKPETLEKIREKESRRSFVVCLSGCIFSER